MNAIEKCRNALLPFFPDSERAEKTLIAFEATILKTERKNILGHQDFRILRTEVSKADQPAFYKASQAYASAIRAVTRADDQPPLAAEKEEKPVSSSKKEKPSKKNHINSVKENAAATAKCGRFKREILSYIPQSKHGLALRAIGVIERDMQHTSLQDIKESQGAQSLTPLISSQSKKPNLLDAVYNYALAYYVISKDKTHAK